MWLFCLKNNHNRPGIEGVTFESIDYFFIVSGMLENFVNVPDDAGSTSTNIKQEYVLDNSGSTAINIKQECEEEDPLHLSDDLIKGSQSEAKEHKKYKPKNVQENVQYICDTLVWS